MSDKIESEKLEEAKEVEEKEEIKKQEIVEEKKEEIEEKEDGKINEVEEKKQEIEEKEEIKKEILDEKKQDNKEGKNRKKLIVSMIITIAVLMVVSIFSVIFALLNINNNKIISGINISGINVSNLSKEEATKYITEKVNDKIAKTIKLKYNEEYETTINLEQIETNDLTYLTNARSIALVKQALVKIEQAINEINNEEVIDIVEYSIKDAWNVLGEITGETYDDELIDNLFSNFCLGK